MIGLSVWLGSMVLWAVFAPQLYKIDPTKKTTDALRGLLLVKSLGFLTLLL